MFDLSKGFTLVELLVVIAIIGVLATLVLVQLGTARGKSRDAKRIADVSQLRSAVELYYDDNGNVYPTALSIANLGKYLAVPAVPTDPSLATAYKYAWNPAVSPTSYHIHIQLEQRNTSALNADGDIDSTGWSGDAFNASGAATEACAVAFSAAATDCKYDIGQK